MDTKQVTVLLIGSAPVCNTFINTAVSRSYNDSTQPILTSFNINVSTRINMITPYLNYSSIYDAILILETPDLSYYSMIKCSNKLIFAAESIRSKIPDADFAGIKKYIKYVNGYDSSSTQLDVISALRSVANMCIGTTQLSTVTPAVNPTAVPVVNPTAVPTDNTTTSAIKPINRPSIDVKELLATTVGTAASRIIVNFDTASITFEF